MNVTVPGTSASGVALVSVRLTVTTSALVSFTVTVTAPVPSGMEIEPGMDVAKPVRPTLAV